MEDILMEPTKKPGEEENNIISIDWLNSVENNHCTNCNQDLTNLFTLIVEGKIPPPKRCPGCGKKFIHKALIHEGIECGNCRTLIASPGKQIYCTECGVRIDYWGT